MSTPTSIANFYVNSAGNEQPIRYKAEDLVNKCAPDGYHWGYKPSTFIQSYYGSYFLDDGGYIAVKNKEQA